MKKLLTILALFLSTLMFILPLTGQARTLDEILSSKTLKVGVNPTLPPLGKFDEKNEIVGFDVDIASKIAEMLGVELEIVQVGSPDR
ncbi:MAG: transporter substrate-binding domain-containing protein, partial [Candidatus Competibacteraceae bacterium]|nr:transporter substrate-binding domain-containing protein [Candidatus Competibacteraceae bacterium]